MRRNWLIAIMIFACSSMTAQLVLTQEIEAQHVILINGKTGKVLWEKRADEPCYPASTTKIATVLFSIMNGPKDLQEKITPSKDALATISPYEKMRSNYKHPPHWIDTDAGGMDIKWGEAVAFEDLLYSAMLASTNDAPNALAEYLGRGSIPTFVDELNKFLKNIGCHNTHFCNPHGLFHPDHVSTARDMARLSQYAMTNPLFCTIAKATQHERKATNKQPKMLYVSTNRMLRQGSYFYPYSVGIKTGYTAKAKCTFVGAAVKDGRFLIAALMRCKDRLSRFQDARVLFDAAFAEKEVTKQLLAVGEQQFSKVIEGGKMPLRVYTKEPLEVRFFPSEEPEMRCELVWKSLELPIAKHAEVGSIRVITDTGETLSVPLYAKEEIGMTWSAWVKKQWIWVTCVAVFMLCICAYIFLRPGRKAVRF
jgi:D-alanyl-D-alanine carboxypeptidase (penicillin-binding protein 5/6)